jgi:hypothetical protein
MQQYGTFGKQNHYPPYPCAFDEAEMDFKGGVKYSKNPLGAASGFLLY